jgi:hypothetical protein
LSIRSRLFPPFVPAVRRPEHIPFRSDHEAESHRTPQVCPPVTLSSDDEKPPLGYPAFERPFRRITNLSTYSEFTPCGKRFSRDFPAGLPPFSSLSRANSGCIRYSRDSGLGVSERLRHITKR